MNKIVVLILIIISTLTRCGCGIIGQGIKPDQGSLKSYYKFDSYTKNDIDKSIKCVLTNKPELIVPDSIPRERLIHGGFTDLSQPRAQQRNADSVSFHFFVRGELGEDSFLYWAWLMGLEENWNKTRDECGYDCVYLILGGYSNSAPGWKWENTRTHGSTRRERKKAIEIFETNVLSKINYYLEHPEDCNANSPRSR
jgi:uncharacterized protein YceK